MQFKNCTTRKPLFHDPYESYGSWTCICIVSLSIDMQFTNCTTRKPLFNDPYESYESWTCIYTLSLSNYMHSTNCTTRKPMFHDPYESYVRIERNVPLYGSYQFVYIGQPSWLKSYLTWKCSNSLFLKLQGLDKCFRLVFPPACPSPYVFNLMQTKCDVTLNMMTWEIASTS